ncbi:MAG TPA: DUF979 domain-containing protein [Rhizomicrobium sp.]|nr:DUF979 domain-containing protein [Rhizomicrobium sp.]
MITLEYVYIFFGAMLALYAVLSIGDANNPKRIVNTAFWGLLAISFLFGSELGDLGNGVLVLALVVLGAIGLGQSKIGTASREEQQANAAARGNWLFIPALIVPVVALIGSVFLKTATIGGTPLLDAKQVTPISLAAGVLIALTAAILWLKPRLIVPFQEGRRLMDTIGWAAILPQMLASLGAVFALAGMGNAVSQVATNYLPLGSPAAAVAAYCIGMALFTAIMGNAFAAFPVMTAAIGLPLIVHKFGGDVVIMGAIGMLSGFCGTLTTPMAANFNIVPAALLELSDRNAVIKAQLPTAFLMLIGNTLLMEFLVYRF